MSSYSGSETDTSLSNAEGDQQPAQATHESYQPDRPGDLRRHKKTEASLKEIYPAIARDAKDVLPSSLWPRIRPKGPHNSTLATNSATPALSSFLDWSIAMVSNIQACAVLAVSLQELQALARPTVRDRQQDAVREAKPGPNGINHAVECRAGDLQKIIDVLVERRGKDEAINRLTNTPSFRASAITSLLRKLKTPDGQQSHARTPDINDVRMMDPVSSTSEEADEAPVRSRRPRRKTANRSPKYIDSIQPNFPGIVNLPRVPSYLQTPSMHQNIPVSFRQASPSLRAVSPANGTALNSTPGWLRILPEASRLRVEMLLKMNEKLTNEVQIMQLQLQAAELRQQGSGSSDTIAI